jgi:hypothetical protein
MESLKKTYTIIKGHVQSGKTNFMICASALFALLGYDIVHLLRDRTSDRDQIQKRLLNFQENYKEFKPNSQIYLALSNKQSITKVFSKLNSDKPYILFIDEVDFVDSGDTTKKYEIIQEMKKAAYCVFGVSATIMDPLGKENITPKNIILLETKSKYGTYKGIDRIQLLEIEKTCKYTGSVDTNLIEKDAELQSFIGEYVTRQPIRYMTETYPNICLINICRTKRPCLKAQIKLSKLYPKLATIVYNSDGISFRQGRDISNEQTSISEFLQKLKDNGGVEKYPHIIIFAGDLSGRCISFVSDDYKWHLSDQRLLISSSCDEAELLQKIRLCGIYSDDIPLKLYTTKKTIDELRKAYLRQEEIICALKSQDTTENVRNIMESMSLSKDKFSRRRIVKDKNAEVKIKKVLVDDGWDIGAYKMTTTVDGCVPKALPPPSFYEAYGCSITKENVHEKKDEGQDEYDRLKKMFKTWADKETKIGQFMHHLDPEKEYTEKEMQELCKTHSIILGHLLCYKHESGSKSYGKIIEKYNKGYRLCLPLVDEFKIHF